MTPIPPTPKTPVTGAPVLPAAGHIHEKDFAASLQVDRSVLKALRNTDTLEPETDWYDQPGRGIYLTEFGQQKIKAALPAPPPPEAPAASEARTLRIWKLVTNPLVVEAVPLDSKGNGEGRLNVKLLRGPSHHYRRGMELPGCVPTLAANVWAYGGPKPRHPGKFWP